MVNNKGLSAKEAKSLLKKYSRNEIIDVSKSTPFKILLRQIKSNFLIYLLTFAMIISFFVGKSVTAYTILMIILVITIIGFTQEYRAEKAIAALKGMIVPVSIVIRDGKEHQINSSEIVPGDIILLRNGEKIPADCTILEEQELYVNEAVLTGESKEIKKKKSSSESGMIFMGSYIVNGRCTAKVVHTGMNTKFGKIAKMISTIEKELPLQKKVNHIAKYMALAALGISFLTGFLMFIRAEVVTSDLIINIMMLVIALSVSAFPEGFPVVLIATLASGAYKMAKQNAIVNRMSIIETLGETTVICSDKTGTITKGEMTVKKLFTGKSFFNITGTGYEGKGEFFSSGKKINPLANPLILRILSASVLCNDSIIERTGEGMEFHVIGTPTESALMVSAAKAGVYKEDLNCLRMQEKPFSSSRKMMSVLCKSDEGMIVYSKGALEQILEKCRYIQSGSRISRLTENEINEIILKNSKMAKNSMRTIAFAYKKVDRFFKEQFEEDLIFLGIAGMEDPAREGVKEAVKICSRAGIKVKMITGDNPETAIAIAKEIGLAGKLLEGKSLDSMTDDELAKIINSVTIIARVKPEHKMRIVNALKANGEIVTMTGDGVNDAPALKEAHIGIAMGKNGTDVSRSVADLTLKDDNFKTIVSAISEGRTIFKNIRKFASYQLSCNFAELSILFIGVLLSPVLGWQVPLLLALQILFMNLVTDNLPAITLGLNPSSSDSMGEKPRKNSEILSRNLVYLIFFTGFFITLLVLSSYFIAFNVLGKTEQYSRTEALFTLISLEVAGAFTFRSFRKGVLNRGLMANPYLVYASVISMIATFIVIYSPLNSLFETVPLNLDGFGIGIIMALLFIAVFDILKKINRKKKFIDLEH